MLTLAQIEQQYPEYLRSFKRSLLREYLQYKILEIIFTSVHAAKLVFIGGTALRMVYDNHRFSEDIDLDNFGLTDTEFKQTAQKVKAGLETEGFHVEITNAGKASYRCNIRFPGLLFGSGLSHHPDEKIRVQIDNLAQGFHYLPERKILNKFDVFTEIFTPSIDLLLSQKINALLTRKRAKGRDFYDVVFLMSLTRPHYQFLEQKCGIDEPNALRAKLIELSGKLDFKALAMDVESFLFRPSESKKVELFPEFIKQAKL